MNFKNLKFHGALKEVMEKQSPEEAERVAGLMSEAISKITAKDLVEKFTVGEQYWEIYKVYRPGDNAMAYMGFNKIQDKQLRTAFGLTIDEVKEKATKRSLS